MIFKQIPSQINYATLSGVEEVIHQPKEKTRNDRLGSL